MLKLSKLRVKVIINIVVAPQKRCVLSQTFQRNELSPQVR